MPIAATCTSPPQPTRGSDPGGGASGAGGAVVLLGIDPGLQCTGYAFLALPAGRPALREAGVIRLDPRESLPRRLAELADSLSRLIESHRPEVLVCEALYAHYQHPRTAIMMAHARGVILAAAAAAGVDVLSVSATQVKKTMTGFGRAGKAQIQKAVSMSLGLNTILEPHDVADAAAIALCGAHLRRAAARVRGAPARIGRNLR